MQEELQSEDHNGTENDNVVTEAGAGEDNIPHCYKKIE